MKDMVKIRLFYSGAIDFDPIKDITNKIRDLFKVKLYIIRSETEKRERERKKRETLNIY